MPDRIRVADAESFVASSCFRTGPPGRVGLELEWIVNDSTSPTIPVDVARVREATADLTNLPYGGRLTYEPGGQLEVSSVAFGSLPDALVGVAADLARMRAHVAAAGLELVGDGVDPVRPPRRTLDLPRYDSMERYFDRISPVGLPIMCSTASVQVNLDAGADEADVVGRWRLLHTLGPPLIAAFANSPFALGSPTGWRSTRQAMWRRVDPSRTKAIGGPDPIRRYARYSLDVPLLCLRRDDGTWDAPPGLTFRRWLRDGGARAAPRPATLEDLTYHLTTIFPPVRPRGWFEVRFLDAQPGDDWQVMAAVVVACVEDPDAAEAVRVATHRLSGRRNVWAAAAREAVSDPDLRDAALACFLAALAALPRLGADPALVSRVERWIDRYVCRGRCPADDRLDAWARSGSTVLPPSPEEAVPC
jgi:glutamate--cysteine ligase